MFRIASVLKNAGEARLAEEKAAARRRTPHGFCRRAVLPGGMCCVRRAVPATGSRVTANSNTKAGALTLRRVTQRKSAPLQVQPRAREVRVGVVIDANAMARKVGEASLALSQAAASCRTPRWCLLGLQGCQRGEVMLAVVFRPRARGEEVDIVASWGAASSAPTYVLASVTWRRRARHAVPLRSRSKYCRRCESGGSTIERVCETRCYGKWSRLAPRPALAGWKMLA